MCVCAYCIAFYFVYHIYNKNTYNMYLLLVYNKQMYYLVFHFSSLWKNYLVENQIEMSNMCDLIRIMFSIASNSGWVERAQSHFAQICHKKRNRMKSENLCILFFLAALKPKPKDSLDYKAEMDFNLHT